MNAGDAGMKKKRAGCFDVRTVIKIVSWAILILCICLSVYLYQIGAFSSMDEVKALVERTGAAGELLFMLIQTVQVVIPIIPGGVSCLAGVLLFGAVKGFILNYVGICAGSIIAFFISRNIGRDVIYKIFSEKQIEKYNSWTEKQNRFTKLFALAIFFPVAPDDFLCYLAGTTKMRAYQFVLIILLGKPLSIAAYSMGLNFIFERIVSII